MHRFHLGKRHGVLALLLLFVQLARFVAGVGEWYACHLYPTISAGLSAVASVVPFSLEECLVVIFILLLLAYPIVGAVRKVGTIRVVCLEVEAILWIAVWFYMGWGCNYFRSDFYHRCEVIPVQADEEQFVQYLTEFTDSINACYPDGFSLSPEASEAIVKAQYEQLPTRFGLCQPHGYQHPKHLMFNRLYSAVGVMGYMGPFMCESQVNHQLLPEQYPFTYAHELAHLLGISSEAEANYWAFVICTQSDDRQLQYCGYYGILPYLLNNAASLLSEEERLACIDRLDPRIVADLHAKSEFWQSQQIEWINNLQEGFYDWYLRSNQIPAGKANYYQVIQMLISVRFAHNNDDK